MVLVHRVHFFRSLVHRHELLRPLNYVHLLRSQVDGIPGPEGFRDGHHHMSNLSDGDRVYGEHLGRPIPPGAPALPRLQHQRQTLHRHVLQLLYPLR